MVNVEGDSFGAGIVAHLSKKELAEFGDDDEPKDTGDYDIETAFTNQTFTTKDEVPSSNGGHFVVPALAE